MRHKDINRKLYKTIELARQEESKKLEKYVNRVLKALGHPEALITDESMVWDMIGTFGEDMQKELDKARKKLKININSNELIINVAKRLRDEENTDAKRRTS